MSNENDLRQAKVRGKKYSITEMAIKKVPFIKYKGLTEEQNKNMQSLAKLVLTLAKNENDSNEVAITWDMERGNIGKYGVPVYSIYGYSYESGNDTLSKERKKL